MNYKELHMPQSRESVLMQHENESYPSIIPLSLCSMAILASREHTCIHPQVSRSKTKNDDCRKLLDYDEVRKNNNLYMYMYVAIPVRIVIKRKLRQDVWVEFYVYTCMKHHMLATPTVKHSNESVES